MVTKLSKAAKNWLGLASNRMVLYNCCFSIATPISGKEKGRKGGEREREREREGGGGGGGARVCCNNNIYTGI